MRVKQLIQVCWSTDNSDTKEREVKALIKAMDEFKLEEGLILTGDFEGEEVTKGKKITYKPLWKWMLQHSQYL